MKMHGLGDLPYWMITYVYFLVISLIYMSCYFGFGVLTGTAVYSSAASFYVYMSWFIFFLVLQG